MISIAICDDDNDFRLLLRDAVYKMIESHGEQAVKGMSGHLKSLQ